SPSGPGYCRNISRGELQPVFGVPAKIVLVCGGAPEPRGEVELLPDAPRVGLPVKGRVGAVVAVRRGVGETSPRAAQGSPSARNRSLVTVELAAALTSGSYRAAVRLSVNRSGGGEVGSAAAETTKRIQATPRRPDVNAYRKNVPSWRAASAGE